MRTSDMMGERSLLQVCPAGAKGWEMCSGAGVAVTLTEPQSDRRVRQAGGHQKGSEG